MTCTDIYVMPSGCAVIQTYPSAPHPTPPDSGGGGMRANWMPPRVHAPKRKKKQHVDTEEDILAALGLFGPRI